MQGKSYELTVEDGKITALKVGGKAKGMRDINKAQASIFWKLYPEDFTETVSNPYSGVEVDLSGFVLSVYRFCVRWYDAYSCGYTSIPIQVYDTMKYLVLAINPDAYMKLLD